MPRLKLVAGHMAVNLVTNAQTALKVISHEIHCWLNSSVALYWIQGQGSGGVSTIKQIAQDPATRPRQGASRPNGR